jgi:hypothetical protein
MIFNTDCLKISFILSLMEGGTARAWKQVKVTDYMGTGGTFPSYANFLAILRAAFTAANRQGHAKLLM